MKPGIAHTRADGTVDYATSIATGHHTLRPTGPDLGSKDAGRSRPADIGARRLHRDHAAHVCRARSGRSRRCMSTSISSARKGQKHRPRAPHRGALDAGIAHGRRRARTGHTHPQTQSRDPHHTCFIDWPERGLSMQIGQRSRPRGHCQPRPLTRLCTGAEELGFDYANFSDHVVIPTDISSPTPTARPASSQPKNRRTQRATDQLALVAATPASSDCHPVMVIPHRPAVLAAKQLATIDVLSSGRVAGHAGLDEGGVRALGVPPFAVRGKLTTDISPPSASCGPRTSRASRASSSTSTRSSSRPSRRRRASRSGSAARPARRSAAPRSTAMPGIRSRPTPPSRSTA